MNTPSYLVFAAASILAVSTSVNAQTTKVYTWTDENGVVHFVDTPPANPDAVAIDAPEAYRPGSAGAYEQDDAAVAADGENPEAVESYADQKRAELAENRQKAEAAQKERERVCAEAASKLAQLEPSRRVYFTNEKGETERMDDAERVSMVGEAQALVDQNCN